MMVALLHLLLLRGHTDCVRLLKEVEEANMVRKQNEADRAMRELLAELAGEKVGNTSSPKKKKKKKKASKKKSPPATSDEPGSCSDYSDSSEQTTSDLDTTEKGIICLICWELSERANLQKSFIECPLCDK